jgi:hypothetical protein
MSIVHILSASLVALIFANTAPGQTPYLVAALLTAAVLDLDSVIGALRTRTAYRWSDGGAIGRLHGLLALLGVGAFSGLLFLADEMLARVVFIAFTIHLSSS